MTTQAGRNLLEGLNMGCRDKSRSVGKITSPILIIIIIIVAWSKTVTTLHVIWQPLWTTTLIKGFQRHHELDKILIVHEKRGFLTSCKNKNVVG